ncbi:MAG: N-6 DNA methylase [Desulfovibrio sp.]|jgi:tRNA1Val (adenine37-N6)-methyltransferase|nr:N-6 DNA methylase [Desulfovibrio sp.]
MTCPEDAARLYPRGLFQPEAGPRFGMDGLLLAAYAADRCETLGLSPLSAVELGSGCGAVLLGLALRLPKLRGLGIDRDAPLHEASLRNAELLGVDDRIGFLLRDLSSPSPIEGVREGHFDIALANPPYGLPGTGRPSPNPAREGAHRSADLQAFLGTASRLLRHHGHLFCIFAAAGLSRLCRGIDDAGLGLRSLVPVRSHPGEPALRVLAHARKDAASDTRIEAGLTLHPTPEHPTGEWHPDALAFCPWLAAGKGTP